MRKSWLKKASVDELIVVYTEEALAQDKAMEVNDYKTGNKHADNNRKVYYELRSREALTALLTLLEHEDPRVRGYAATDLLEVAPEQGERILEELEHQKGFTGLGAEYALKEYRKRAGRYSHIPKDSMNLFLENASVDELITAYVEAGEGAGRATELGDDKDAQRNARIILRVRDELEGRGREAFEALVPLLHHENPVVRCSAAADMLGFFPEQAERVLEESALSPTSLVALLAKTALEDWRKEVALFDA